MESDDARYAAEALTTIADSRAAAADRLVTPWWYHPVLGLLVAGYVVALSFGGTIVRIVAVVLFMAGTWFLVRTYARVAGVWISGFEAGRASRWAYTMGGVMAAGLLASLVIAETTSLVWPTWCIAALLFLAVVLLGRRFDVALRAELRSGA